MRGTERKIFDPGDAATGTGGAELLDASVVQRGDQWWMYLAGQASGYGPTEMYSASLPSGAPLSATGWELTRGAGGELAPVAGRSSSARMGRQRRTALPFVCERMGPAQERVGGTHLLRGRG